ncbi:MAG: hypothetical protein WC343_12125, partial [Bacilli bacterium]
MKTWGHKKIEKKVLFLIILLSSCVALGLLSLIIDDDRSLSFAEKGLKDIVIKIESILYMPIRLLTNEFDKYQEMQAVYQKYKDVDNAESQSLL